MGICALYACVIKSTSGTMGLPAGWACGRGECVWGALQQQPVAERAKDR